MHSILVYSIQDSYRSTFAGGGETQPAAIRFRRRGPCHRSWRESPTRAREDEQQQVRTHQLRCFLAVAEEVNFRRVAERLNMTQPPLSRQIKLLEHGIGLTLLERGNRMERLTPAGESLFASATDLHERVDHAVLIARQSEHVESGSVEVSFVPSASLEFVPRIIDAMASTPPNVTFNPTEMMNYEVAETLLSGHLDLGLSRMTDGISAVDAECVVREQFIFAVPKNDPLAPSPLPRISHLDGKQFVGYSADRGGVLQASHRACLRRSELLPRSFKR